MYKVTRSNGTIQVNRGNTPKFSAPEDSLLIYKEGDTHKVSRIGSLTDEQLLLALVNVAEISNSLSV